MASSSGRDPRVVSTERARLLLGNPGQQGLLAVANVAAELYVGDSTAARVLAYPAHRDAQQLGDVRSGEQSLVQQSRGRLAQITDRASPQARVPVCARTRSGARRSCARRGFGQG